jgi:uncharacterized protein (DUF1800 family)
MESLRAVLALVLCLSIAAPSASASDALNPGAASPDRGDSHRAAQQPYQPGQLRGDERILHALNRFTFGPRPGDLDVVRAVGLEKWFDQQLHPETLDRSDLNLRLAEYPAMQLSPSDLLYRFPSNAIIRQAIDRKTPTPDRGALEPIYRNEIARVEIRRLEKDLKNGVQNPVAAMAAMAPSPMDLPTDKMAAKGSQVSPMQDAQSGQMSMAAGAPPVPESQTNSMSMAAATPVAEPTVDPALIANLLAMPPAQRIAHIAELPQADFDAVRKALKPAQRAALSAGLTPAQKEYLLALENPQRVVNEELVAQRLTRDIYSNAQLQEVMTDFWLNHFNVYLHKNDETPYYLVSYERDVLRPRAFGKFEDLLEATAHSPAMLLYLDNSNSMGPDSPNAERDKMKQARNPNAAKKVVEGLNENYARELMELHTLGVNGGYTQADVTQVARVFTGWTVDRPQQGGGFKFDQNRHEPGTKKVLGKKIKENGEQEGREVLHMLAMRPATAQFLSRKLAIRFVGDDPSQALVDRMAKTYLSSGGDIAAVLKTLFRAPEFWSESAYRAKVKTPLEYIVSAARASNAVTDNLQPLVNALRDAGMPLYGAVPPTGYNWQAATWVSTGALVNRMNFALSFAANKLSGISVAWSPNIPVVVWTSQQSDHPGEPSVVHVPVAATSPNPTPEVEEQRLESMLVAGGLSPATRTAVLEQFQTQIAQVQTAPGKAQPLAVAVSTKPKNAAQAANALEKQDQLLAGLLLGSPEFQRR